MKTPEQLILKILNKLSEKFKTHLVLKGGILMALYNSPRATQDIDFVLTTKNSKKNIKSMLLSYLQEDQDLEVMKATLNSRGIFIEVRDKKLDENCLIEISVAGSTHLPPEPISTAPLAQRNSIETRIVTAMSFEEAFSHKIAASLERRAMRDLFDLSQMQPLGEFDLKTLESRLENLSVQRAKRKNVSFDEAANLLEDRMVTLKQKDLDLELNPLLPTQYRKGLLRVIKSAVNAIIISLRSHNH